MKSNHEPTRLVDLGSASEKTLGADGYSFDLVRELPIPGINHD